MELTPRAHDVSWSTRHRGPRIACGIFWYNNIYNVSRTFEGQKRPKTQKFALKSALRGYGAGLRPNGPRIPLSWVEIQGIGMVTSSPTSRIPKRPPCAQFQYKRKTNTINKGPTIVTSAALTQFSTEEGAPTIQTSVQAKELLHDLRSRVLAVQSFTFCVSGGVGKREMNWPFSVFAQMIVSNLNSLLPRFETFSPSLLSSMMMWVMRSILFGRGWDSCHVRCTFSFSTTTYKQHTT